MNKTEKNTKMLEHTINHKKIKKYKKTVQYKSLNKYSLFPKLWPEPYSIYSTKELGKETDLKILTPIPCQCTGTQESMQNHDKIFPVGNIGELFRNPNVTLIAIANAKLIEHNTIYNFIGNDGCYKDNNSIIDVKIPAALETDIQSGYISAVENNFNSCSILNAQKILYLLVAESNLRNSVNNEVAARAVLIEIFELITDVNVKNFVHQAALCQIFSNWYFLNIAQGLRIKFILRSININTLAKIDMKLCLILCNTSTNTKVMLHFTSAIPLDEYHNLIYCMMFACNTKGVSTDHDNFEPITKEAKDNDEFGINFSDQCTQTKTIYCVKTYQDVHSNTEAENDLPTHQDLESPKHTLNANIWLPKLCGESCEDKTSFMTYILKCSCFNEALVNLDIAEKYVRIIYDIMSSPSFHKLFLKDLGKCLLSTFLNTVI